MRTLILLGNLDVGGAERTALELAVGLRQRGGDVQAASLHGAGPLGPALRAADIPLREGLLTFRYDATAAWRIAKLIRREEIDTLLLVDIYRNAMFCGLWGARLSGRDVRTVLWCSAVPTGQAGNFTARLRRYFRRDMLREIVCVNDWQRKMLCEYHLPGEKMRTIHNGVDLGRFSEVSPATLPGPADAPALLHVANVMPDKDFDTLLSAAALLRERKVAFRLFLAGRGTDSAAMLARIDALGLAACVFPLGGRDDVPALLAAAEVAVLATRSEVFNIAVLEAMAASRPVVVSDVSGFDEMFDAGREGFKVPPGDPHALAEAIERLLGDADLRAQLAQAGRRRVEHFSRQAMCDAFAKFLEIKRERE